ncbi:26483_t:CDS:1, partial [Gigaspora margarita]
ISTTSGLSNHVTEIPESSSENIPTESQENDQDSELPEAKVNASTEETKSQVSDSSISANSETEISMPPISQVNISNKSLSVLPDDPEKKRTHVIKMVLERFSCLTLKYSNKYGDYFDCPKACLVCNKEHKRDNVK